MSYAELHPTHCSEPYCPNTVPSSKWHYIRSGWFFQKNGDCWCPEHIPDWVAEWRVNQINKRWQQR